jgi:exopolysaccharide biosynthesis polyprenyl glycosylphosphotransferase
MYVGGQTAAATEDVSRTAEAAAPTVGERPVVVGHKYVIESLPRATSGGARGPATMETDVRDTPIERVPRRRHRITTGWLALADFGAAAVASAVAFLTRFGSAPAEAASWAAPIAALSLPFLWVAVVALNGGYDARFVGVGTSEFGRISKAFLYLSVLTALVSYGARLEIARGFVVLVCPLMLLLTLTLRVIGRMRVQRMRRRGEAMNRVLAVGSAKNVQQLAVAMKGDLLAGLHVVGVCLPPSEAVDPRLRAELAEAGIPVFGSTESVRQAVDASEARSVAVVAGDVGTPAVRALSWELERSGVDLIVSSGLEEMSGRRVHVQSVAGVPLLRVDEPEFSGFRRVLKGAFDRCLAAFALLVLAPVLLALAAIVRFTSKGPAFYLQTRIGRNGQEFRMVKFRSMYIGADALVGQLAAQNAYADGLLFKIHDDPRITPVGRALRRFSLDELPQLFNVLVGSMSLVGPRPPLPSQVAQYGDDVRRRLLVKPGLTGLWQVSGRNDLSWEDSVRLDLHYVENWSFALDMVVLMKTARVVVKATGAY